MAEVMHPGMSVVLVDHMGQWLLVSVPDDCKQFAVDTGMTVPMEAAPLLTDYDAYAAGLKAVLLHAASKETDIPLSNIKNPIVSDALALIESTYGDTGALVLNPESVIAFIRSAVELRFRDTTVSHIARCPLPPAGSRIQTVVAGRVTVLCMLDGVHAFRLLSQPCSSACVVRLASDRQFWALLVFMPHEQVPAFAMSTTDASARISGTALNACNYFTETCVLDAHEPQYDYDSAREPVRYVVPDMLPGTRILHVLVLDASHAMLIGKHETDSHVTFVGAIVGPTHSNVYTAIIRWSGTTWVHLVGTGMHVCQVGGTAIGEDMPADVSIGIFSDADCCCCFGKKGQRWTCIGYMPACVNMECPCHRA
jgi:hypothetical protein